MKKLLLLLLAIPVLTAGCMVGPNYKRPHVNLPATYRGEAKTPARAAAKTKAAPASLGNEKWWRLFQDPVLDKLIRTAIRQNYNVRIAATRVTEAQAQFGITRANLYPSAGVGASLFTEQNPKVSKVFPSYEVNAGRLDLSVIWNLDFWGKYRRESQAAQAQLLATEWGRRAVIDSVVAGVAGAYFQLRALDGQLAIARRTLASRRQSLQLTELLERHGSASLLEVSEARQLVYTAAESIPDLQRQIEQQENLLSTLLGQNPGPIPRGRPIAAQPAPATVPAGLPSELIDRRPDVREAEDTLIAANADIGVVKAELFPSISLTGTGGLESYALNRLIGGPAETWNAAVDVTQPIFEAGALRNGVRLAKAQWRQMLLTYRQTILTALEQVSNALIAYQKDREFTREQRNLVAAARQSDQLSMVLYRHGGASYLQVLTTETNYFAAELNLVQAEANERLSLVQLYQALGGGWQQK